MLCKHRFVEAVAQQLGRAALGVLQQMGLTGGTDTGALVNAAQNIFGDYLHSF